MASWLEQVAREELADLRLRLCGSRDATTCKVCGRKVRNVNHERGEHHRAAVDNAKPKRRKRK